MVKIKTKKRKLVKKVENSKVEKKTKTKKKKKIKAEKALKVPKKKTQPITTNDSDSDSDSDGSSEPEPESESDKIQKLLEPYNKDQLTDFIINAAIKDLSLFDRIRDAADRDVSHRRIFVHGLGWETTTETLISVFEPFGEIEECTAVTDRATGKSKGFGFVLFESRKGAVKALKQPRKKIDNRLAWCQLASAGPGAPSQSQDSSDRKIYVSNVQADVDKERLRAFFTKFGEIETGPLGFDMVTGKSRGFALFVYTTQEGAKKAIEEPHKLFEGHQLHCRMAAKGKNKVTASVTTVVQPVQTPVLAATQQNLAYFSQHPSLYPMYGGLVANPNVGFFTPGSVNPLVAAGGFGQGMLGSSQVGQVGGAGGSVGSAATGIGGYSGVASHAVGGLGGSQSLLGAYGGSTAPMLLGSQHAYPQMGQTSSANRTHGAAGSFSGYPSYSWVSL